MIENRKCQDTTTFNSLEQNEFRLLNFGTVDNSYQYSFIYRWNEKEVNKNERK